MSNVDEIGKMSEPALDRSSTFREANALLAELESIKAKQPDIQSPESIAATTRASELAAELHAKCVLLFKK